MINVRGVDILRTIDVDGDDVSVHSRHKYFIRQRLSVVKSVWSASIAEFKGKVGIGKPVRRKKIRKKFIMSSIPSNNSKSDSNKTHTISYHFREPHNIDSE